MTPQLTISSEPVSATLTEQDPLSLVCSTNDYYPRTAINWLKDGIALRPSSRIDITDASNMQASGLYQTQSTLSIANTRTTDAGAYYCKVILQIDGLDRQITVRVDGDINIMVQGEWNISCIYAMIHFLNCSSKRMHHFIIA